MTLLPSGHQALAGGGSATSGAATRAEWETVEREARERGVGALDIERDRLAAREVARFADLARINALVASGQTSWDQGQGGWQKPAGRSGDAADALARHQAEQAERERVRTRPARFAAYLGEHGPLVDQWGEPRNYSPQSPPDWFV